MNISRRHITIALIATLIIGGFGHVAHAQIPAIVSLFGFSALDTIVVELVAQIVNMGLKLASWLLAISGLMLNVSMNITLNIKDFVDATPAIFTVWKSIRDITGMFIIFMLLFAAIRMILAPIGVPAQNMGQLVKTIVVAGVLINFSFFVAGLGIDVSNIVSMQLYNTIAPAQTLDNKRMLSVEGITNAFKQGGISNIFMSSLKITSLYDPKTLSLTDIGKASAANSSTGFSPSLKIILIGTVAFMIMITAAISFALAALAFTVRFVILLFLLAFSPIWFASYAIPDLKKYASKWTDLYKGQMLFMPVYLLLMYFAMSVLISNDMMRQGFAGNFAGDQWYSNIMILSVNAVLVIFMLNAPLVVAMSIMGSAPKWANNLGAGALWSKLGKFAGNQAGTRTIGRAAYGLNESTALKRLAGFSPLLGGIASKGLSNVGSSGFGSGKKSGYEDRLKAKNKAQEAMSKRLGSVDRSKYATEAEADAAEQQAREFQKNYRNNLPLNNSVLGFMLDDRGNKQTALKLNKEAEKQAKKSAKKEADASNKEIRRQLENLESIKNNLRGDNSAKTDEEINKLMAEVSRSSKVNEARKSLGLESVTLSAEQQLSQLQQMKQRKEETIKDWDKTAEALRERMRKNNEAIEAGRAVEEEEKDSKLFSRLDDIEGKTGAGGDKKEESKKP